MKRDPRGLREDQVMIEHDDAESVATPRERELELEVGRLEAELATLRGEDPATATTRFLLMAAATADLAVADARREADEIVEEVSAKAEARRDEATRVAAEAEALAEQMLADADRSQVVIDQAAEEAASIRAAAEVEAENVIALERERADGEISALAEIRVSLDTERDLLDSYHETLRHRVQELAESMVTFMTETPLGAGTTLDSLVPPQLEAVLADSAESVGPEREIEGRQETPADVVEPSDGPWAGAFASPTPVDDRILDVPDASIDEIPEGPVVGFGGEAGVDSVAEADIERDEESEETPSSAGLFSRASADEPGQSDLPDVEGDDDGDGTSLFGSLGERLLEQSSPSDLADALATEDSQDEAFRQFIDGDAEPDPSRDWLMRPDRN